MTDNGVKTSSVPEGFELFYAMYAVGLAFGIQEISEALYKAISPFTDSWASIGLNVAVFFSILFLVIRFFWSTENIRRGWGRVGFGNQSFGAISLVVHLPALLIQGVLVLFVCFAFADRGGGAMKAQPVILWFVAATVWNAIWLLYLVRGKWPEPESFWIANNIVFAVLAVILLVIAHWHLVSEGYVTSAFIILSLGSSFVDLSKTSRFYLYGK